MNQILSLREKRANLWNEAKAFLDSHRSEDGIPKNLRRLALRPTAIFAILRQS